MPDEQDNLKLKIDKAEAMVENAQKVYDEAEPGPFKESYLQLFLAEKKALKA